MEYSQENVTPIKIKLTVQNSQQEVDAAINKIIEKYRASAQLPGFRPGKAPANLIAKKFASQILDEAREELLDGAIKEIAAKEDIKPIANLELASPQVFEKGKPTEWGFSYEVMPEIELPEYKGLKGELAQAVVDEENVSRALDSLKALSSARIPVTDNAPPRDGQIANLDIDIIEDGKPVADFALSHYDMEIGKGILLPEIDVIARGLPVGSTAEKEIAFPDDFPNPKLAGQTRLVRMKINSVVDLDATPWNNRWEGEEGEKKLEDLKDLIRSTQLADLRERNKSMAETDLLEQMLKQVDFPVPEAFTDFEYRRILSELNQRLRSRGLSLGALGEQLEKTLETAKKDAEKAAARQTLLLAIAASEGMDVSQDELLDAIEKYSKANGEDFAASLRSLQESGTISFLRAKLLSDKAMDFVYENAEITEVPPKTEAAE